MNKFIIASCIIALTFAWTTTISDHCSCSDYNLQIECSNAFGCAWGSGTTATCQNVNCTAQAAINCLTYPTACQLNTTAGNNTCLTFSSCSNLQGANNTQCQAQNVQCVQPSTTATETTSCAKFSCSLYNSANCPSTCYVSGSNCVDFPTCSSLTSTTCTNIPQYCSWNGASCQPSVCSNLTSLTQTGCNFVFASATTIQPCYWNSTACVDASSGSNLNSTTTCFANTVGAYHWSTTNVTDGSCKSCYGVLLQIVFAIILLLA